MEDKKYYAEKLRLKGVAESEISTLVWLSLGRLQRYKDAVVHNPDNPQQFGLLPKYFQSKEILDRLSEKDRFKIASEVSQNIITAMSYPVHAVDAVITLFQRNAAPSDDTFEAKCLELYQILEEKFKGKVVKVAA